MPTPLSLTSTRRNCRRRPSAVILNSRLDSRMQPNRARFADRFGRVLDEVQERALQRARVAHHVGQAGIEILQHDDALGRLRKQSRHPHRLMQHHVDIDRLLHQPLRPADHQHLLNQRRNPIDAVQDDAAVLLRAPVVGEHPGHQLGRALDSSERILDLVREARRRQPQAQIAGLLQPQRRLFRGTGRAAA